VGPTYRRGEEEAGYRFEGGVLLGRGLLLELGQIVSPGALLYFYFSFASFSFSNFFISSNTFKFDSKRFKPTL
jgi:hypothetical protein